MIRSPFHPAVPLLVLTLCGLGGASSRAGEPPTPLGPRYVVKLPFPPGTTYLVIQGNRSSLSHNDYFNRYAWDFEMPEGTPVCACAPGTVVEVKQDSTRGGLEASYGPDANFVVIDHGLARYSKYFHLQANGVTVKVGETVQTGQVIAHSGRTGVTNIPHLHFCLSNQWNGAIPARFSDFKDREGIPYAGSRCTSGPLPDVAQPVPPVSLLPRQTFQARGVELTCDLPARLYQTGTLYLITGKTEPGTTRVEIQIIPRISDIPVFTQSVLVQNDGTFHLPLVWPNLPPSETSGNRHYRYFLHLPDSKRRPENLYSAFITVLPAPVP